MIPVPNQIHRPFRLNMFGPTVAITLVLLAPPTLAQEPPVSIGESIELRGEFATVEMKPDKQRGVSGMACLTPQFNRRYCLAVNDEERFAQWAILENETLEPKKAKAQLLTRADTQIDSIVGTMPGNNCEKVDDFGEFDGEAIAISAGKAYISGSHACTRSKKKFKPSAFVLARFDATGEEVNVRGVQRTWRVSDIVHNSPLKDSFARPGIDGTNIEGIAIAGGRIYLGFRTPIVDGKATILHTDVEPLFFSGSEKATAIPDVISLSLGAGVGIRDLAALQDGRLLVLTGPAMDESVPYLLHVLAPSTGELTVLVELRTDEKGKDSEGKDETAKAEAIAVLFGDADSVTIIVNYDNINDGGPRMHQIALPKQ